MPGLIPGRGRWLNRTVDITAASTFTNGDALGVAPARTASLYSGGAPNFLGIAQGDSANSVPSGKIVVAISSGPECTLIADVPTGVAASALSFGQSVGLYAVGGRTSYVTTSYTSDTGRPFFVAGPINSANSTIELGFKPNTGVYGSAVSAVFA
jgi:hypothetical protein